MIAINSFKNYVDFLAAKHQSGASYTPDEFNNVVPIRVNDVVRRYYGLPEEYMPMHPQPRITYEVTQYVTDFMRTFKVPASLPLNSIGRATIPDDYRHVSSIRYKTAVVTPVDITQGQDDDCCDDTIQGVPRETEVQYREVDVDVIKDSEVGYYLNSSIVYPTKEHPKCCFYDKYIQVYPTNLNEILFTYLRYPIKPVWNYTIVDGMAVYDPTGSVDIELPEECMTEMAVTFLSSVGIHIREEGLIQYANFVKEKGN